MLADGGNRQQRSGGDVNALGGDSNKALAVLASPAPAASNSGFGGDMPWPWRPQQQHEQGGAGVSAEGGSSEDNVGGEGVLAVGGESVGGTGGRGQLALRDKGQRRRAQRARRTIQRQRSGTGNLSKGGGSFKIDHPLDPENKYLYHSFVESPDMKNIYDGNVTTDANGEVTVQLPDWFEALNRDFRYQLTVIGTFAQAIVAEKIKGNRFVIKTSALKVEVSWQVTGIRQDAFANKHRIQVEEAKPERERGYYLHPGSLRPARRAIRQLGEPSRDDATTTAAAARGAASQKQKPLDR